MLLSEWYDHVAITYKVVEYGSKETIMETRDLSTAIDTANDMQGRHLVLRMDDSLVWDTEWNNKNYHWKIKRDQQTMQKLVILDYSDSSVHIFDVEDDVTVDEKTVEGMGFHASNCSWILGNLEITYHKDVLTTEEL